MTITYPLAMPATPKPRRLVLRPSDMVGESRSVYSGERQVYAHAAQWWELEIAMPSMVRADAEPWLAFLTALRGKFGTFTFVPPTGRAPQGLGTGSPVVSGGGQTGNALVTAGWTDTITGILKAGDYIQFGTELHKVLTDATSDGAGAATLDIWPNIRTSPADNTPIVVNDAAGIFALTTNARQWEESEGPIYDVAFTAIEAF